MGFFKRNTAETWKDTNRKQARPAHGWALELNQREIILKNNVILCPVTILSSLKYGMYYSMTIVQMLRCIYVCMVKREFHFGIAQCDKKSKRGEVS